MAGRTFSCIIRLSMRMAIVAYVKGIALVSDVVKGSKGPQAEGVEGDRVVAS